MRKLLGVLGLMTLVLGACAHDRYARRECNDCRRRCAEEEHICFDRHEEGCRERRRGCEESCRASDWCR